MDFNITVDVSTVQQNITQILSKAVEFSYEAVALNTVVDFRKLSTKKYIPQPKVVDFKADGVKHFRVLNRITAVVEESMHCHNFLKSDVTKKYDIVALQPVGEKILKYICSLTDFDIISLNLNQNLDYNLKRTTVGLATDRGICFEITYAPMLRDQISKRMVISNSQSLVSVLKGRNIIISSGAIGALELRSVNDVINLMFLFGFGNNKAESAVKEAANLVLKRAWTRKKTGCGFVSLSGIHKLHKQQGWIVHACKLPKLPEVDTNHQKRIVEEVSEKNIHKRVKLEKD